MWILLFIVALYWLPLAIAACRRHPQIGPIAVINIFLGCTLIGWATALAWSMSAVKRRRKRR